MICERDIKENVVADTVNSLIKNKEKLDEMSRSAANLAIVDGTKRICDIVADLAKK